MAFKHGTETEFELTTLERLEQQRYKHVPGADLDRNPQDVVLVDRLEAFLRKKYPELSDEALRLTIDPFARPEGIDMLRRNLRFHRDLIGGVETRIEESDKGGDRLAAYKHSLVYAIDWENPEENEFLAVNQLSVSSKNDRRPDIVLYVNGLPLVLFELKNPYSEKPTVDDALNQIAHYRNDIPQLFDYNALCIVSDGNSTLHGMWSADREWYAPWKSIDGKHVEPGTTGSMKTLVEGLLRKDRLLQYIRDFIAFETAGDVIVKKGAKYHQFFAVQIAAERTLNAVAEGSEKKLGVIWHTTGSGKSLSMLFLVGLLRRKKELENPIFLIQVDRQDLDNQLYDQFIAVDGIAGHCKQAQSVEDLRDLFKTEGGGVFFSTIEKFRLKGQKDDRETEHPILSTRSNIIIIADEAHRSQYGFKEGFARYLAEALPNARRLGFTGTPISFSGADTEDVFGDTIHTYDIRQSQEDGATVPIWYTPRQVKLRLASADVDAALKEATSEGGLEPSEIEKRKTKWAALARAAGAKERLQTLARDLLSHFTERTKTLDGKAIVVCMTRENCVGLYDALTDLPGCPEVKVVMTGNLSEDPEEWSRDGHITTKQQRNIIKKRMKDIQDPLKIAIVCDMWLTGTDIPCLHTLYVDKPMRGHNLIQAISRVNRVFRDKPHGLIVDYMGIGDDLRDAADKYSKGGGQGNPAPDVAERGVPVFMDCLEEIRGLVPKANYAEWRKLSNIEREDLYTQVYGYLMEYEERRDHFLQVEHRFSNAFLLVQSLNECRGYADEVIFFQTVRKQLRKTLPGTKWKTSDVDQAVRDLIDETVESEGVLDIFTAAGIERQDISILTEEFLQTFKDREQPNLRLALLEKLLRDEIHLRQRKNVAKAKSFKQLLEETLKRYHNRLIDAAAVIKAMIQIRKEMETMDRRAAELGMSEEELAFYDAVHEQTGDAYADTLLRDLIHEVVQSIKRNLKVDWTEAHRSDVKAAVRAAVKRVLRSKSVKAEDLDRLLPAIMTQAEELYANWPLAA